MLHTLFVQVEYLLKKMCMAMSVELNCVELEDFISQDAVQQNGFTVWSFLEMMNTGKITRGMGQEITSMAIEEVYREIVADVLKEVGYLKTTEQHLYTVCLSEFLAICLHACDLQFCFSDVC